MHGPLAWPQVPARNGGGASAPTPAGASRAGLGESRATQARALGGVAAAAARRGNGSGRKRARVGARGRNARTSWGSCGGRRRGRRRCEWRRWRGRGGRPSSPCRRRPSRAAQRHLRRAQGAASERWRRRERAFWAPSSSCRGCARTFRRAEEVLAAAARGLRRRGSTPDAKNALVRPHNGCTRARAYHRSRPSSVMDEMWARAVVPDCLRSFIGLRSMCR